MKKDQKQIQARVLKKLSALRATLSNDERKVLDGMLIVDNEVKAHRLNTRTNPKVKDERTQTKVKEVEAHRLNTRTNPKVKDERTQTKVKEVEAHRMNTRTTSRTTTKTPPPAIQIAFDQDREEYKITE